MLRKERNIRKLILLTICILFTTNLYSKTVSEAKHNFSVGGGGYLDLSSGYLHSLNLSYERVLRKGMLEFSLRPCYTKYEDYYTYSPTSSLVVDGEELFPEWTNDIYEYAFIEVGVLYSFRPYFEKELSDSHSFILNYSRMGILLGGCMYVGRVWDSDLEEYRGSSKNWGAGSFEFGIAYKPEIGFRFTEKFALTLNVPIQLKIWQEYWYYPRLGFGFHLNFKFFN